MMKDRVQGCVTAGVALVGAGVVAALPIAQQAPEVVESANADVQLAAALTGTPAENLALSAQRTVTGLVGAPIGFATAAIALAQGTPAQNAAAAAILNEIVDGPLWAADPAIYALDDLLPAPIGGSPGNVQEQRGTSLITQFRADQLISARDDINEAIKDALVVGPLNAQPDGNEVSPVYAASRLGAGFALSGVRAAQSAVTAPLGLVAVAEGLQKSLNGDGNTDLYLALQAYIDGPNYVTDPIVFAADDVLPQPIGGDPQTNPAQMNGSQISRLRGNVLLAPRDAVRNLVAGNLGVDPIDGDPVTTSASARQVNTAAADTTERTGPVSRIVSSLKATPGGGASTESTGAKHRAPTTGGLSNLFKKPVKKTATTSESGTGTDNS
jgi:hypothetical protein